MDVFFIELAIAAAGLAVGAVLTAIVFRLRTEAILEAAVAHGRSKLEVELATQVERLHAAEADLQQARQEAQRLQEAAEGWRKALDVSTGDKATLNERASRVPALESEVARLTLQLRINEEEMRRLAAGEAQKEQSLRSTLAQVQQLERDSAGLQAKLESALKALHDIGERRAALEEQAGRVHSLEQQLREAHLRYAACNQQLLDLRGSAALENGRLGAELTATREMTERLRGELATARGLQAAAEARVTSLARESAELRMWMERTVSGPARHARVGSAVARRVVALSTPSLRGVPATPAITADAALAPILAASGLREGVELHAGEGQRMRITLPQGPCLLLDAGLPMTAYERHVAATNDEERARALAQYLGALREHLLMVAAARGGEDATDPDGADLSLLFVPAEAAFLQAIIHDEEVLAEAWRRNVLVVSPSTLLFVLRMVAQCWRRDAQARNGQAIADQGARLYERLFDFCDDLDHLGEQLLQARQALDAVHTRLREGDDSVLHEARTLRDLGVQPTRELGLPGEASSLLSDQ